MTQLMMGLRSVAGLLALILVPGSTLAAGNLASRPMDIELTLKSDLSMSNNEYKLETGKYVRWTITNAAIGEEFEIMAPDLWRNSYLEHISFGPNEVFPFGVYSIEIDEDQEVAVFFVPMRPGDYDFWIKGQESRGMKGKFIVR